VVREVLQEVSELVSRRGTEVELSRTVEEAYVLGSEQACRSVFSHILRNAVEATPGGGVVRVGLHQRGDRVIFEVSDDGPGIPAGNLSKIFQPGFTTKQGSKGRGLSEVEQRLAELRGAISWQSPLRTGKGARFTVTLAAAPPPHSAGSVAHAHGG
jgi:signal transduction histidine kinase